MIMKMTMIMIYCYNDNEDEMMTIMYVVDVVVDDDSNNDNSSTKLTYVEFVRGLSCCITAITTPLDNLSAKLIEP